MVVKRGWILGIVFLLVGCTHHSSPNVSPMTQDHLTVSESQTYQYEDFMLYITRYDDLKDSFEFQIELNGYGIGDFAEYTDSSHQQATCTLSHQKDMEITFTFEKDCVIVKANGEENYLSADVSGRYVLQEEVQ